MTDETIETVARAICRANVLSMMKLAGLAYHDLMVDAEVERLYRDDLAAAEAAVLAIGQRRAEAASDAQFLLDRLSEIEINDDLPRDFIRDWFGHVEPAIARFRSSSQTP